MTSSAVFRNFFRRGLRGWAGLRFREFGRGGGGGGGLAIANDIKLTKFPREMRGGVNLARGEGECPLSPPKMHLKLVTLTVE